MKTIKSYKAFEYDWTCRGIAYGGVGSETSIQGELIMCKHGIHSCRRISDVIKHYPLLQSYRYAEIKNYGKILEAGEDRKICSSKIKILRELSFDEVLKVLEKENTGVDNNSDGVNNSYSVNSSNGVAHSGGVSFSNGLDHSHGVSHSKGVECSNGVDHSHGVSHSYGVKSSNGVTNALFLVDKKESFSIFGKEVNEDRFNSVYNEINNLNGGWYPKFDNVYELYFKVGGNWEKTPLYRVEENNNTTAWADMPKETIDYIKSLPEFDANMFKKITGIE